MALKVAIQGGRASFHDMACREYFGEREIELRECVTFRQQCVDVMADRAEYAVMAIENSLAGSILPNYALLQEFPLIIRGEAYLQIEQNLMALPGQKLSDIHAIRSHPMALHQCSEFLERHQEIRSVESFDTAESAREISEKQLRGIAAIAGCLAAELYDLAILEASIENIKDNYTRFLVLSKNQEESTSIADKASLSFHVRHEVGALAGILNIFRDHSVNLGLIQSIPIPGRPDEYAFHVDIEWRSRRQYEQAIEQVRRTARELVILGEYKAGKKPYGVDYE